ncbi:hypothetical protein BT93_B1167 [Corymbia citriodora subsp. variegata]|nr:hypothetical protein BT93_B1167 [Corymbia citriodora subsp. variegata]
MGTGVIAWGERFLPEVPGSVQIAIDQVKLALDSLEVPVGYVIPEDGIAAGRNSTNETQNATRHAETEALDLDVLLEQWERTGLLAAELQRSLYVTCGLCIMTINGVMGILDQRVSNVVEV